MNDVEQAQGLCFDAWTASGAKPESWTPDEATQQVTVTDTVTFTAQARSIEYQAAFDANGGEGAMPNQSMVYGETQALNSNEFARTGYVFAGWSTTPEWTGEQTFEDQQEVVDLTAEDGATVTLYAQWEPWAYYVSFNPNGATPNELMTQQQFRYDVASKLISCAYERENYHFTGWNTEADGSGDSFADEAVISTNLTEEREGTIVLYAQWEHDSYTVNFDANGGTGEMEPQNVLSGTSERLNPCLFTREGYTFTGWNTAPDGSGSSYEPNAALTEDLAENGGSVTLYAQWEPIHYTVRFDANSPQNASTQMAGAMDDQDMSFDQAAYLPACGFDLLGYDFTGWNTEADGSGTAYAAGQEVVNLASQDGQTVTLYAQWRAQTYTVNLYLDTDEQDILATVETTFDEPFVLPAIEDSRLPQNQILLGWNTLSFGSLYIPEANVLNLCSFDGDGALVATNLYAVLGDIGSSYIVMTNDDSPVSLDDPADITLVNVQDGTQITGAFARFSNGVYEASAAQSIPSGTYRVTIDGWSTGSRTLQIDVDGSGLLALDYHTVEAAAEDHARAWIVDPSDNTQADKLERVLGGSSIGIGASTDAGYSFESWSATGIAPEWQADPETGEPDSTLAVQSVIVNGRVLLEAHPAANSYRVVFDPNGGIGEMEAQDMVYDQPQSLYSCTFMREGHAFLGWNTEPDGTGTSFADGQEVLNLTSEAGATVTLYAQWQETPQPSPEPEPQPLNPDEPQNTDDPDKQSNGRLAESGDGLPSFAVPVSLALASASGMLLCIKKSGREKGRRVQ